MNLISCMCTWESSKRRMKIPKEPVRPKSLSVDVVRKGAEIVYIMGQ